ncbi:MAG: BspA family leucine-rich repeat surface protein [Clostridia bacterium]|nr:BspA family leucine-rich repeat surface protein [Clostridia bacterium]
MKTKTFKKLISLLLCLVMCLALIPSGTVFAADNIASGSGWYIDSVGRLYITGAVHNNPSGVVCEAPWVDYDYRIKAVYAKPGASIDNGKLLFDGYRELLSIDLTNLNTTGVTNMEQMVAHNDKLTNINFGGIDTSAVTNMRYLFMQDYALETVDLSGFNTAKVTTMAGMFGYCNSLSSVNCKNLNTSNVTLMNRMFYECNSLTSVNVSSFDTSKVTNMAEMFAGCINLETINIKNFSTSNVQNFNAMFLDCRSLKTLDLYSFSTLSATRTRRMFAGCSGLQYLDLGNFSTSRVTEMFEMFAGCSSLTYLNLTSFDTSQVEDMGSMFKNCVSLKSLDVTSFNTAKVTDCSNMFYNCGKLTVLAVSKNFLTKCSAPVYACYNRWTNATTGKVYTTEADLKTIVGNATLTKPLTSGTNWYIDDNNCLNLIGKITMTTSGSGDVSPWKSYKNQITAVTAAPGASVNYTRALFKDCPNLVTADLRNLENKSTNKSMREMFYGCTSLTTVNLKNFNTTGVTDMCSLFLGCTNLKTVYLSTLDTATVTDMSSMFYGCSSLVELNLSNFEMASVQTLRGMFYDCTSLKSLNLGDIDLLSLPSDEFYVGSMFSGTGKLTEITLNPASGTMAKLSGPLYSIYKTWTNDATNTVYKTTSALNAITGKTKLIKGEAYKIWIGDTRVTSANRIDVLGDGSVVFLPSGKGFDPYLTGETLVLNNVNLVNKGYTTYTLNGKPRKAVIRMDYDLSIYLIGENYIGNTYEEDMDGIYVEWEDFVGLHGNGSLDISVSNNGGRAINAPGATVTVYDNVTLKLKGHYGFYTDYTSDIGYFDLMDNAKVYANGLRTDDDKEGNAICTCFCRVGDNAYLYCEYEWNQPAFASWGEDFYYDTPVQVRGVHWRNFPSKTLQTLNNFNKGNGNPYEGDYYIVEVKAGSAIGDVNKDGYVNARDITALKRAILTGSRLSQYDLNRDVMVDVRDLVALKKILAQ